MGSYQRFSKSRAASVSRRRRDEEWHEAEFRRALRRLPKPRDVLFSAVKRDVRGDTALPTLH